MTQDRRAPLPPIDLTRAPLADDAHSVARLDVAHACLWIPTPKPLSGLHSPAVLAPILDFPPTAVAVGHTCHLLEFCRSRKLSTSRATM